MAIILDIGQGSNVLPFRRFDYSLSLGELVAGDLEVVLRSEEVPLPR